jgi:hypothetical protein
MVSRLLNYGTWIRRSGVGITDRLPRGTYSRTAPVDVEAEPSAASHNSAGFTYALHMTVTLTGVAGAHPISAHRLEVLP